MEYERRQELRETESFLLLFRMIRGDKTVLPELIYRGGKFVGGGLISSAIYLNKMVANEVKKQ